MMRTTQAIAAICAVLVLASCGKDEGEPIPESRAARLESLLQQVQRQSDNSSCVTLLKTTIPALEAQAERLPASVGSDTQETITDGVAHLRDLAETDCAEQQQDELPTTESTDTEQSTSEETTPSTESTDTEPSTSEETTPPETTPPETTTPETTPPDTPPDNPPGNGGTPPGQEKKGNRKADQVGGIEP